MSKARTSAKSSTKKATKAPAKKASPRRAPAPQPPESPEATAPAAPIDPAELAGFVGAFDRLRPEAEALADRDVLPARADLRLALHNARQGVAQIDTEKNATTITALSAIPGSGIDLAAIRAIPDLIGAALVAEQRIDRSERQDDLPALLAEAFDLRKRLLTTAEALAASARLPDRDVAKIRSGRGVLDAASDCVALAALYQKHPAVLRETPLKAADLKRAATLGTELLGRLTPTKGRRPQDQDRKAATALRDRFWTLAVTRYRDAWRIAAFLHGPDIEGLWPTLQTRVGGGTKKKPKKETGGAGEKVG